MTRQGQRNITQQLLCHSPRHAKGNCSLQLLQLQYNYDNGGGGIVSPVRLVRVITYCWNDDPLASDGTRLFVGCCGNLMSRKQYHRPTERPTDFEKNVLLQKVSFNYEGPSHVKEPCACVCPLFDVCGSRTKDMTTTSAMLLCCRCLHISLFLLFSFLEHPQQQQQQQQHRQE